MERYDRGYEVPDDFISSELDGPAPAAIGIPDGEILEHADHQYLIGEFQKSVQREQSSFFRNAFMAFRMIYLGSFCNDTSHNSAKPPYKRTKAGFVDYCHDIGIEISPDELNRWLRVYATYRSFPALIPLVNRIGPAKAYAASAYVQKDDPAQVEEMLKAIAYRDDGRGIPHSELRRELAKIYPRTDGGGRSPADKRKARKLRQHQSVETVEKESRPDEGAWLEHDDGALFIPRHERFHNEEDETWVRAVFKFGMKRKKITTIDEFLMALAKFVYQEWLNDDDRRAVDQERSAARDSAVGGSRAAAE